MSVQEFVGRRDVGLVTADEAARMVQLWTRLGKSEDHPGLELRDVAEALGISNAQAASLLSRVREEAEANYRPKRAAYILLAVSLGVSAIASIALASQFISSPSFGALDWLALLASLAWTFGWPYLYRRPILRTVENLRQSLNP